MDASTVTQLAEREAEWVRAGGTVYVAVGAVKDGVTQPIPAGKCERLATFDGIDGAFAMERTDHGVSLSYVLGGRASFYRVSPGVFGFLDIPQVPSPTVIATAAFAERTGIATSDQVRLVEWLSPSTASLPSSPLTVRIADTSAIGDEYDGAVLVPNALAEDADLCFVRTAATTFASVGAFLPQYLSHDGDPAIVSSRLFASEYDEDYSTAFLERLTRWMWIGGGLFIGFIWMLLQWFRRSHVAIYSTFGMGVSSRAILQFSEWARIALVGAAAGWALGITIALASGARVDQALAQVSYHAALTTLLSSLVVAVVGFRPAGSLLDDLKDR
ncbi:hypothetical protein [Demequina sp.]|uniref:hypothetical protein n=1 Tax=Demequina sp. TaxID=2050685 RepID=UPI003A8B092F